MNFLRKYRILVFVCAAVLLAIVFWWGGNAPDLRGAEPSPSPSVSAEPSDDMREASNQPVVPTTEPAAEIPVKKSEEAATEENKPERKDHKPLTAEEKKKAAEQIAEHNSEAAENKAESVDNAASAPAPMDPQNTEITDQARTCTLAVRCDTILDNMAWLDQDKIGLVPQDGVIFAEQAVTFYEGESVFNVLLREMKKHKIHMEFSDTAAYHNVYIEGINNLYEYDCGELSGWMYKVNGQFPNYSCSRYRLKEGDRIEVVYTCNLGVDVGGHYTAAGE